MKKLCHVLQEKPVTRTIEQADEVIQLAESGGLVCQAGHLDRFNAQRRDHAQHYSKLRGQSSRA